MESSEGIQRPSYDASCYLCPGNSRAGDSVNPNYEGTFVFKNDFAALLPESKAPRQDHELLTAEAATGECRVICFSPRHDLTLATMDADAIEHVISLWQDQILELGQTYRWVQVFENHGSAMGASNPHPHGQIWATDYVPTLPAREDEAQREYFASQGTTLLEDYVAQELRLRERVVIESEHWVWLVPFWATWPFEVLLLPKRPVEWLPGLTTDEVKDLATILKRGLQGYDRLFGVDFPYSMGWHGLCRAGATGWHLHAHFYPPLLRSASIRKFMVGFEMLGESQRDITPEQAAQRLRDVTND